MRGSGAEPLGMGLARERALALPQVRTGPSELVTGAPGLHLGAGHSLSFSRKFTPRPWSSPPFEPRNIKLPTGWVEPLTGWSPLSPYPHPLPPGSPLLDPVLHSVPTVLFQLSSPLYWWLRQTAKNLPAMQETRVQSLGQEDPLKKGMATCLENPMNRGAW